MNRRQCLVGGARIFAYASGACSTMLLAKEALATSILPAGSVDCHVHVFEPDRFSFASDRSYTPGPATVEDLKRFHVGIGIARAVLVQPSPYGVDNGCLLAALRVLGPQVARGIAVVDPTTVTKAELDALKAAGVVGIRVNLAVKGEGRIDAARKAVAGAIRCAADHGLIVQIYVDLPIVEVLSDIITASPVPVVFDHYAGAQIQGPDLGKGLDTLQRLLATGKIWIKLSAPYKVTVQPDFADVETILKVLISANPDRLVWGSDWPHTGGVSGQRERKVTDIELFRVVDDKHVLDLVAVSAVSDKIKRKIFVGNAEELFRF